MIKQWIFILLLSFIKIFSLLVTSDLLAEIQQQNNLSGASRAEFKETEFDFGKIFRGQKVSHAFQFTNDGNANLIITGIHATCGCVSTKVYASDKKTIKDTFAPRESGFIEVDFDSGIFSGDISRPITLDTNMPNPSTITLTIYAEVMQEIWSEPSLINLSQVPKNYTKVFLTKINMLKDIELQSVTTSAKFIEANLLTSADGTKMLQTKISGPLPIGALREKIIIKNSSKHLKELIIPVLGEIEPNIYLSSNYLEFGVVTPKEPTELMLNLKSQNKNFNVTGIDVEINNKDMKSLKASDFLQFRIESAEKISISSDKFFTSLRIYFKMSSPAKKLMQLNVFGDEKQSTRTISGIFLIKTNDVEQNEIKVPFYGAIGRFD